MKKTSRNALVISATAVVLALTTACSGSGVPSADNLSPTTPSASAAPTVESIAGTVVNGMPTKPELTVDAQGRSYAQVTVKDTDPMIAYKTEIRTPTAIELFTEAETIAAQKVASKFILEEMADSFLKGDNITQADKDLWWEKNKNKFDSAQVTLGPHLTEKPYNPQEILVYMNPERAANGYSLEYGPDKVHVSSRHFAYEKIVAQVIDGTSYLGFRFNMYFDFPVTKTDGTETYESTTLSGEIVFNQVAPEDWKISGITVKQGAVSYGK